VNQARKRALREARQAELTRLPQEAVRVPPEDPSADAPDETLPTPRELEDPAAAMVSRETFGVIERALADLPESQRNVVLLSDVEGVAPDEVCNILGISGNNQRVLLHRGRARVRQALDLYMKEGLSTKGSGERMNRP